MIMEIRTLYEKGGGKINEDALIASNPIFGVFDGASSLVPYVNNQGQTGAYLASHIAKQAFSRDKMSLFRLAIDANWEIERAMVEASIDTSKKTNRWATTAAVIRLNKDSFDWVQIGDSLILVIHRDASSRLLATDYDHDLQTMIKWKKLADKKVENIRAILDPDDQKVTERMNIDYGAMNGEIGAEKFLKFGTEKLDGISHIILFTDGLFFPKEDPEKPDDWEMFVAHFLDGVSVPGAGGLKKVHQLVRALEDSDPNCWKYPRFKQHDDIAAISISF